MYFDDKPCRTCGAEVRLEARWAESIDEGGSPVGPEGGVVGGGDPTVDARTCTNPDCPSHRGEGEV
ncbi:hypothetical protein ASE01_04995 [Nocardioides sp. Root190]|uniref:hypothetical protein n=1 Tax=Nocardioides sp. Root190 TaxID=1736488 RepID=UPI0006FA05BB|nr:hypothetical protein [Nocardioides sp. Root190]KRB78610.1 hypothetical protein ASE01_04995 [Nocardioides sp. Root190]